MRARGGTLAAAGLLAAAGAAAGAPTGNVRVLAVEGQPADGLPGWTYDELFNMFQAGPVVLEYGGVWFHARVRRDATGETADALVLGHPFGGGAGGPLGDVKVLEGDRLAASPSDWRLADLFEPLVGAEDFVLFKGRYGPGDVLPGPTNEQDDVVLAHDGVEVFEIWREGDTVNVPLLGPAVLDGFAWLQTNRRGDLTVFSAADSAVDPDESAGVVFLADRVDEAPSPRVWPGDTAPWLGGDGEPLAIAGISQFQTVLTDDADVVIVATVEGDGVTEDDDQAMWVRRRSDFADADWPVVREGQTVRLRGGETATIDRVSSIPLAWEGTNRALFAAELTDSTGGSTAALYVAIPDGPPDLALAPGDEVIGLGPIEHIPAIGGSTGLNDLGAGVSEAGKYVFRTRFGQGAAERSVIVHAHHAEQRFECVAAVGAWVPGQGEDAVFEHLGASDLALEGDWTAFTGHYRVGGEGAAFSAVFVRDEYANVEQVIATGDMVDLGEGDFGVVQTFLLWNGDRGRALNQEGWLGLSVLFEDGRSAMLTIVLENGSPCGPADLNRDGFLDYADILEFLIRFGDGSVSVDQTFDRTLDFADVLLFVQRFVEGCPG